MTYRAGIDIGSTTVKLVILDSNDEMVFSDYCRHHARVQDTLRDLLSDAREKLGDFDIKAKITGSGKKILDEFFTTMGMQHHQSSPLYRFIGKSEYEKLIAGNVVNSRAGYNGGVRFDVTPKPDGYFGDYRVKLNVEASPETMRDYWPKRPLVSCQKSEQNYYHWNVREYDIKDVRSIVDWRNKKVVYESDDEILSNFIDGYLSKLG